MQEMQETLLWSLCQEDALEKETETHSSILAWRITWTEEPGGIQCTGLQRVGHDWSDMAHMCIVRHILFQAKHWAHSLLAAELLARLCQITKPVFPVAFTSKPAFSVAFTSFTLSIKQRENKVILGRTSLYVWDADVLPVLLRNLNFCGLFKMQIFKRRI